MAVQVRLISSPGNFSFLFKQKFITMKKRRSFTQESPTFITMLSKVGQSNAFHVLNFFLRYVNLRFVWDNQKY
eukprot:UN24660